LLEKLKKFGVIPHLLKVFFLFRVKERIFEIKFNNYFQLSLSDSKELALVAIKGLVVLVSGKPSCMRYAEEVFFLSVICKIHQLATLLFFVQTKHLLSFRKELLIPC
jgi:hypothetical protein